MATTKKDTTASKDDKATADAATKDSAQDQTDANATAPGGVPADDNAHVTGISTIEEANQGDDSEAPVEEDTQPTGEETGYLVGGEVPVTAPGTEGMAREYK